MSKIEHSDAIQVLEKEIKWCIDNPDSAFHPEYRKGFVNGLIQAKYLVSELAKLDTEQKEQDALGIMNEFLSWPADVAPFPYSEYWFKKLAALCEQCTKRDNEQPKAKSD